MHITLVNAVPLPGGRWGALGSSGQDLRRHIAVLGELAKARLRTRLHDRLGVTFERDRATREWEVVSIPRALRDLWSRRSRALCKAAGPGASAAKRRAVAARLAWRVAGLAEHCRVVVDADYVGVGCVVCRVSLLYLCVTDSLWGRGA